jgi:hypothetical protein
MTSSPRSQLLSGITGPAVTAINTNSTPGQTSGFIPASVIHLQGLQQSLQPNVTDAANGGNVVSSLQVPNSASGQFLMPRFLTPAASEDEREQLERDRAERFELFLLKNLNFY